MKSITIEDDVPRLDELKKHVYGMGASVKADQYTKTTKAIAEYVGRVYGHDMKMLVLKGEETVLKEPEYPTDNKDEKKKAIRWLGVQCGYQGLQIKKFGMLQDKGTPKINKKTIILDT